MRCRITLLLLGLAATSACATEVVSYTGEENYERLCAACHGATGKGDGPVSEVLTTPVPDLTRITERNGGLFPRDALKRQIDGRDRISAHGSQQMPVWGYEFWIDEGAGAFSERQVAETLDGLVDYLESLQVEPLGPRATP
jgi:mono/diheme cytochrome c family protein